MSGFEVIVVGAGLGGLGCAIACRRAGIKVTVYEKEPALQELGAGILLCPNVVNVMQHWDLLESLGKEQATPQSYYRGHDYRTGEVLFERPGPGWAREHFGASWYHMHRADYQRLLANEAIRLGAEIKFNEQVTDIDCSEKPSLTLRSGVRHSADLIVGADGVASLVRKAVVGGNAQLKATGDVAYRALIPKKDLQALKDPILDSLIEPQESGLWTWLYPGGHSVLYPVRDPPVYNLVMMRPDDLPDGVRRTDSDREQMQAIAKDWGPIYQRLLSSGDWKVSKWKIEHMEELPVWSKGGVLLIGDACHPTPPYQAQGAALAVEDGATLGELLGLAIKHHMTDRLPDIIHLFVDLRKQRTALQLKGALQNRDVFHLDASNEDLRKRNLSLQDISWDVQQKYKWYIGDMEYQRELHGHDCIEHARRAFRERFPT